MNKSVWQHIYNIRGTETKRIETNTNNINNNNNNTNKKRMKI